MKSRAYFSCRLKLQPCSQRNNTQWCGRILAVTVFIPISKPKLSPKLRSLRFQRSSWREQLVEAFSPDLILLARSFSRQKKVFDSKQPQSSNRKYFSCKWQFQVPINLPNWSYRARGEGQTDTCSTLFLNTNFCYHDIMPHKHQINMYEQPLSQIILKRTEITVEWFQTS